MEEPLDKRVENHKHWYKMDVKGWQRMRADFSNEDLISANLSNATLPYAIFVGANLFGVDFRGADLRGADFSYTVLSDAIFDEANLRGVNFAHSVISGASFNKADLCYANFESCMLTKTNLSEARNLKGTLHSLDDIAESGMSNADIVWFELMSIDPDNRKTVFL